MRRFRSIRLLLALPGAAATLLAAAPLHAQVRTPPSRPDSVRPAPLARDTTPVDSARADSARARPDSVFQALQQLPGYTATEYAGDSAVYRGDARTLRLIGSAEVVQGQDRLNADTILFQDVQQRAIAIGNPKATGAGQAFTGDTLFYDLRRKQATVLGGRATVAQGAQWQVAGDLDIAGQGQRIYASNSTLTTDDRAKPQYHFRVGKAFVIRDRVLVGRPAWLYFGDVPVFPLPFIFQDLAKGRRSGILTPRFGINDIVRTSSRYQRQISNVGYYFAINDYLGSKIAFDWRAGGRNDADGYRALDAGLDFEWKRQFLNGNFNYKQYWPGDGGKQSTLAGSGAWRPDERTSISGTASYASSSRFVVRKSTDPLEQIQSLTSTFSSNRRFDWGNVSLGATRNQELSSGKVNATLPTLGINVNPITLLQQPIQEQARWYNNATISGLNLNLTRSTTDFGDALDTALVRATTPEARDSVQNLFSPQATLLVSTGPSLRVGNVNLGTSFNLNRNTLAELPGNEEFVTLPQVGRDRGSVSANVSYQQQLIGSTAIYPTLGVSQQLIRNDSTDNRYVFGARRLNFGARLENDLYGFFPGVGPYSAIRHHFKPSVTYIYSPEVTQTAEQAKVFGADSARAQSQLSVGITNTFEAKLKTPEISRRAGADSLRADSASADSAAPAVPLEPRKVTVLAVRTSAVTYDFEQARRGGNGFTTSSISNNLTSDYLGGLNVTVQHSLFAPPDSGAPLGARGRFSPRLTSFNTGFRFGADSPLFRFLGLGGRGLKSEPSQNGLVPGDSSENVLPSAPAGAFTGNTRAPGGGAWSANFTYNYSNPSPYARSLEPNRSGATQTLNGNIGFSPTPNWAVNWNTSYSVDQAQFNYHSLSLTRDLYRWRATFNFNRGVNGNTSLDFTAQLIDLPDLRIPYRERNIGGR